MSGADDVSLERLEAEISELTGNLNAATCRWLLLVAEFDRREGWARWGLRSCAQWLAWRCGLSRRAAQDKVRVARALTALPVVQATFGRGQLSYAKVRAITRVATPESEAALVELAVAATTAQLEGIVRDVREARRGEELATANAAHERRRVTYRWDDDGSLVLSARLTPEQGAALLGAMDASLERSAERSSEAEPAAARRADALADLARRSLASEPSPDGAPRPEVVVHVDATTLVYDADGDSDVEDGPSLPPETVRRLGCDADVVVLLERDDGTPLDVGRRSRTVPRRLRRALRSRDGGCVFPACGAVHADGHHVRHWSRGGPTDLSNLVLLCRRHHRLVHEGGYRMEHDGRGRVTFFRPDGRPVPTVPSARGGDADAVTLSNLVAGVSVDAETCLSTGAGESFDRVLAVDAVCSSSRAFT